MSEAAASPREAQRHGILIVDDEEAILESLELTLGSDYRVFSVASGEEGLAICGGEGLEVGERSAGLSGVGPDRLFDGVRAAGSGVSTAVGITVGETVPTAVDCRVATAVGVKEGSMLVGVAVGVDVRDGARSGRSPSTRIRRETTTSSPPSSSPPSCSSPESARSSAATG